MTSSHHYVAGHDRNGAPTAENAAEAAAEVVRVSGEVKGQLWADSAHVARGFRRLMATATQTPESEYLSARVREGDRDESRMEPGAHDQCGRLHELIAFSQDVSQPLYGLLVRHLEPLCRAYAALGEQGQRTELGRTDYATIFGRETLPGKVKKKPLKPS